jgi:RimJ/RimL family protein N-acetyltransferase
MPTSKTEIRSLQAQEVALFRDLRLQALQESPAAFDQTYQEEAEQPIAYWQALVLGVTPPSNNTMLIAVKGQEPVAVVYGFNKGKGAGSFGGMWVAQQYRQQGIASELVASIFQWAKKSGITTLRIWNVEGNEAAQNLYQKFGFQVTGETRKLETKPERVIIQLERKL